MIDVNTKLVGLLGYPLKQSFSPVMQNRAFQAAGLNYYYFPIEADPTSLKDVLNGIRRMNFAGCNVTKPNKIEVMAHLDRVDPAALAIGAVNTVKVVDGKLIGYNTDGLGFAAFLEQDLQVDMPSTKFFILGCGGAGRAIATVLADRGAGDLFLSDASAVASESLATAIWGHSRRHVHQVSVGSVKMQQALAQVDVVINATAVGMFPDEDKTPLSAAWLDKRQVVCDIIYNPLRTRLLREAEAIGCRTANGLGMVIYQGAAAFSIWTGLEAPVTAMRAAILELTRST